MSAKPFSVSHAAAHTREAGEREQASEREHAVADAQIRRVRGDRDEEDGRDAARPPTTGGASR